MSYPTFAVGPHVPATVDNDLKPRFTLKLTTPTQELGREDVKILRDQFDEWLKETEVKLPTKRGAIIKARVKVRISHWRPEQTEEKTLDLVLADTDHAPWRLLIGKNDDEMDEWFGPDEIISFVELFPGLED